MASMPVPRCHYPNIGFYEFQCYLVVRIHNPTRISPVLEPVPSPGVQGALYRTIVRLAALQDKEEISAGRITIQVVD